MSWFHFVAIFIEAIQLVQT
ncbi:hypothetical protein CGLO_18042 [Colletotrichum gloeosporioides Cg-14]|uniref:Uncharacterized protein n=1 Tax=Colletotrichum gloeosporioides (strain Cg-14) TaxID=1237896 RepID=T0JS43_COLGC|nr:hypothetical protein CGLO_18042 [Colletotrichum gloeosporioides Cg-14]